MALVPIIDNILFEAFILVLLITIGFVHVRFKQTHEFIQPDGGRCGVVVDDDDVRFLTGDNNTGREGATIDVEVRDIDIESYIFSFLFSVRVLVI